MSDREAVMLVHGLWAGPWIFAALRVRLAEQGYAVHTHAYASQRTGLDEAARALARRLAAIEAPRIHVVAHSLGGVVTYHALRMHPVNGRVVMMAVPWRGSFSGQRLARLPMGEWLRGNCLSDWLEAPGRRWTLPNEVATIAGTRSMGMGRFVAPGLPRPNDGAVTLDETDIDGARARLVLAVSHSGMLLSARVARQITRFLRLGHFSAEN